MRHKVILDTDIGTDVDDAWALGLCLAADSVDLLGVTLVHADLSTRAKIALKFLRLANRLDVPVYAGLSTPLTEGKGVYWGGHEGEGIDFSDVEGLSVAQDAISFILETVSRYQGEVCVCAIGPLTNIAEAIRREPETMRRVKRIISMVSDYKGEGVQHASREHNACVDPLATRIVLESGIPTTVVGLNVTMRVTVSVDDLRPLMGWSLGEYLALMSRKYMQVAGRDVLYMHDPLAVATIIDPTLTTYKDVRASVLEDGRVVWEALGPISVCFDVDADSFVQLLRKNIYSLRPKGD